MPVWCRKSLRVTHQAHTVTALAQVAGGRQFDAILRGVSSLGGRDASPTGSVMGPSVTVDAVLGEDEAIGSAISPRVCVQVRVRGWLPGPTYVPLPPLQGSRWT
jgi:hypothetical protein